MLPFDERFKRLLKRYRKPDGAEWTPAEIRDATNGFVNLSYISNLQAGRIRKPGMDKLKAMAEAMGFPWQLWLEDPDDWEKLAEKQAGDRRSMADLLNHLFTVVENFRTGRSYTTKEVAQLSGGKLTQEQVEDMRRGGLENPTLEQVLGLSDVFGVDPGYWFSSPSDAARIDRKTLEALRDVDAHLILKKSLGVAEKDRSMILLLIERLQQEPADRWETK
jgi:transcriptional regulator with XRE-family HTH domain